MAAKYVLTPRQIVQKKEADRIWYQRNRERKRAYDREYYAANAEKIKAASNQWYCANKDHCSQTSKEYRQKNLHVVKLKNSQYKRANPAKVNAINSKRRSAKRNATPPWLSKTQLREIVDIYQLAQDLSWLSEGGLHVDHIVPLKGVEVCGLHVPWNLQVIPAPWNIAKSNRSK